jgi:respiratory nitrate reductase gamma subunit
MESLLQYLDQLLFGVLPYVAAVTFVVLIAARRYGVPPFIPPRQPPPSTGSAPYLAERVLFGYGILVILAGHVLGFLIPEKVLLWNSDPLRLYVLEVSALIFGLMTLVGLVLTVVRCSTSAEARRGTHILDWFLYALLLLQVASGVYVALFHGWGSSWYAISAVPYLRSVFKLDPNISFISAMPVAFKVHVATAYVLLAFLPLTRLARPFVARTRDSVRDRQSNRVTTIVLLVGLGVSLLALIPHLWSAPMPGNHKGYEPLQPIAFSHRLHAGELQVSCLYCHHDAEKGPHAGIPAASECMSCHRFVTAPLAEVRAEFERATQEKREPLTIINPEVGKLYSALGLNDKLKPDPDKPSSLIHWVKVHNLPAFTHFDHRAHVGAGVECQHCHGPVETMERVRQVEDLSMGWCVQCHRDASENGVAGKQVHASNDCTTCHH